MLSRKRELSAPDSDEARTAPRRKRLSRKECVEVMCRICGLVSNERRYPPEELCAVALDEYHVKLKMPSSLKPTSSNPSSSCQRPNSDESSVYKLTYVFDEDDGQRSVFDRSALDLIQDLIHGKNSLLFTYGISGSGKTYTMTGNTTEESMGILPRALDLLFNSLVNLADKCVFCSNRRNGFTVLKEREASLARRLSTIRPSDSVEFLNRFVESRRVSGAQNEMIYAVFVSYIEIYNDVCYDLNSFCFRVLPSKELRMGLNNSVFVDGVVEVEVQSSSEALEQYFRGQEKRSVADTLLNKSSSRSHSVFNIRLVMAPAEPGQFYPVADSKKIHTSQLSLVDLAGSERTKRTGNVGKRLAETCKINQSLLVLRQCFEKLRANQSSTIPPGQVPYRESKLTYLFKNFFEGSGKVRMIICLNPKPDDYNENLGVMSFAELSKEVLLPVNEQKLPTVSNKSDNIDRNQFMHWMSEVESDHSTISRTSSESVPEMKLESSDDMRALQRLKNYFIGVEQKRKEIMKQFDEKDRRFDLNLRKALYKFDCASDELDKTKRDLEEANKLVISLNAQLRKMREHQNIRIDIISACIFPHHSTCRDFYLPNDNVELNRQLSQRNKELTDERERRRFIEIDYAKLLSSRENAPVNRACRTADRSNGRRNVSGSAHRIDSSGDKTPFSRRRATPAYDDSSSLSSSTDDNIPRVLSGRTSRSPKPTDLETLQKSWGSPDMTKIATSGNNNVKVFRRRSKSAHLMGTLNRRSRPALPPHLQRAALRAMNSQPKPPVTSYYDCINQMPLMHESASENNDFLTD
ncbi:unnamed protein product [Anisakis simplex]|uniref:Kinesin-like protein n=1 Tax=Anisakis simplex TaxID=6269 RepID=A0A0M3K2S5_ANISI|nr:unnamed protein product [Anisakis simplex]